MIKKQWIHGINCKFHLGKGGKFTVIPTSEDFSPHDLMRTYNMAILHARKKKIKMPVTMNRIEIDLIAST